jgi:hypothetical protein
MTLNPAELLKQARDSNRLSDLATINTALNLFSTDVLGGFMGTSTVVYVSLPSTTSTCSNLGLPTLPSGYTYNCVTQQNLRNTDGTGWIPVNFQRISSNSPISQLPTDPINTTTTRLYYTYTPGGSWELNATVEASKNKLGGSNDLTSKDGGSAPSQYEIGNNLNLSPIEQGDPSLVGYWNFEEGPNATSTDRSGYGNHGTWYGTSTQEQHYAAGKVGSYAGSFNGINDRMIVLDNSMIDLGDRGTLAAWAYFVVIHGGCPQDGLIAKSENGSAGSNGPYQLQLDCTNTVRIRINSASNSGITANSTFATSGIWMHIVGSCDGVFLRLYKDSVLVMSSAQTINPYISSGSLWIGKKDGYIQGYLDDVRIYNRALSTAEISALYNATK